jgi:hypothetical protein
VDNWTGSKAKTADGLYPSQGRRSIAVGAF